MKPFDELQQAEIRSQFRNMYRDIGFEESLIVLFEIIQTANILLEVLTDEKIKEDQDLESS